MLGMKKILLVMGIGMMAALAGCAGKDVDPVGQAVDNIVSEDEILDVEIPGSEAAGNGILESNFSENGISENSASESVGEQDNNAEQTEPEDDGVYFTMEEVKALDIPEDMLAYWLVLNSKIPFISSNEGCQEFYFDEYYWYNESTTVRFKYSTYLFADLDQDGDMEMILTGSMPDTTQLFDYQDGRVYGYQFRFRGLKGIRTNGVYDFANSASNGGYARITEFDHGSYTEEVLAYWDVYSNGDGIFEVEGREVSQDELSEYLVTITEAEKVEQVYSSEGILDLLNEYLLEGLSEEEVYMLRHVAVEPMSDTAEYPMEPEVMQAYYEVLTSEKEFISVTDDNERYYLNDYHQRNGKYDEDYQILYFSIVDMDGDGMYEVVFNCVYDITQILHYENGNVYSYQYDYKYSTNAIGAMNGQGIFDMGYRYDENSGSIHQFGRVVSFNEDGCVTEEVDYNGNINDDRIRYYYFSEELIEKYFR